MSEKARKKARKNGQKSGKGTELTTVREMFDRQFDELIRRYRAAFGENE